MKQEVVGCPMPERLDRSSKVFDFKSLRSPTNAVVLSIDLDMWWHCRWAQGGPNSRWRTTTHVVEDFYGGDRRRALRDFRATIDKTLVFSDVADVKVTYFILGEVAELLPEVVREISSRGHEIACHGYAHVDATQLGQKKFFDEVERGKKLLEDLTGNAVTGYRAPNLVVTHWMFDALETLGFAYDSSVCPARSFSGKYGLFSGFPSVPFEIISNGTTMTELPIAVFPFIKLPSHSGIFSRFFGTKVWTEVAQKYWNSKGTTNFYFHPFEICRVDCPDKENLYMRAFFKGSGDAFFRSALRFVGNVKKEGRIIRADHLVAELQS